MAQNLLEQAVAAYFKAAPFAVEDVNDVMVSIDLNQKLRAAAVVAVPGIANTFEWTLLAPFHLPVIDTALTGLQWRRNGDVHDA
jgi:hypothetical protein